ncbi:hypothetical protein LSTR_LSTR004349 [Laodelphax striatellus]|uniref:Phospholipid-transporting ATPase n=2 Tax=Laodelphax striatellus TaxID=195883 RepID=A0A482X9N8_LAOST|nr:hypothetical protein LSTR_LSTR004349 [Laodelphax striatellus]
MKNATAAPLKRSTIDRLTNTQVLCLFFLLIVLCLVSAIWNQIWTNAHTKLDWYLNLQAVFNRSFGYNLLTFVILYNNLIPISLQVTLEIVRFVQAIFINMDIDMYHEESNTPAMARTSNLNEELGMVKYIFSDKTGTLTRNVMEFKQCSVADEIYFAPTTDDPNESMLIQHLTQRGPKSETIKEFLTLMAVCHTVIPEKLPGTGEIVYHASSPDERALLQGAKAFGFVFDTRTPHEVEIVALENREKYNVLNVLEFTSARKRMSVIVRMPNGKIRLYCKGADSVIYERLSPDASQYRETTLLHLEEFAQSGLRTLCFAMADINEKDYKEWAQLYNKASTSMQNREVKMEDAANMIERNLYLLGATAVEDKLQDQVPETIAALLKADINVWVLTGDKQETAINIGYSTKLISQGMPVIILNETSLDSLRESIARHCSDLGDALGRNNNSLGLVVDGTSLKFALSHELRRDFLQLCLSCRSVICCRVSPIQKAEFRFLLKLLFVHGSWNYTRMCKVILYSFYKNICLYVMELWFAIYSGFSGQILFERWTIGFYNVIFTSATPFAIGLFDKVCSAETMMRYPKLYSHGLTKFDVKVFWVWIFNSLYHSVLLYWLTMYIAKHDVLWANGKEGGYLMLGNMVYTYTVVTVCVKAGLHMNFWTWVTYAAIVGSVLMWFLCILAYSHVYPFVPVGQVMLGMDRMVFTSGVFWIGMILVPFTVLILDVAVLACVSTVYRSLADAVRVSEIRQSDTSSLMDNKNSMTETARLLKNVRSVFNLRASASRVNTEVELRHGFAFSQEESGAVSQSDMIRAYDTNLPKPGGM